MKARLPAIPVPARVAQGVRRLACPPTVSWARESNGILVVNERSGQSRLLTGLEWAVWGWLSLGMAYPRLVELVTEFLVLPAQEAEQRLLGLLEAWRQVGLLEEEGRDG